MSDAVMHPIRRIVAITPHDTTDFESTRAIMIETTGPVAVIPEGQTTSVTIAGLLGGVWHPMRVTRILDTGTTATTVYAGY